MEIVVQEGVADGNHVNTNFDVQELGQQVSLRLQVIIKCSQRYYLGMQKRPCVSDFLAVSMFKKGKQTIVEQMKGFGLEITLKTKWYSNTIA